MAEQAKPFQGIDRCFAGAELLLTSTILIKSQLYETAGQRQEAGCTARLLEPRTDPGILNYVQCVLCCTSILSSPS